MHCTNCNLVIDENDAFRRSASIYCCEGCANHTGCTCNHEKTPAGERKLF